MTHIWRLAALLLAAVSSMILSHNASADESSLPAGEPAAPIELLIKDLASSDGEKQVQATRAILAQGKTALDSLRKAGAEQLTPDGEIARRRILRRIDMVYTLIDGLKPNSKLKGYDSDRIGLEVRAGTTGEYVAELGKKYGFQLIFKHTKTRQRMVGVKLNADKKIENVIREVLTNEPAIITVKPVYWDKELPRCSTIPITPGPVPLPGPAPQPAT